MLGQFAIGGAAIGGSSVTGGAPAPTGPTVRTTEARVFSIISTSAAAERLAQARVLTIYTYPANSERVSAFRGIVAVKRNSHIEISEVRTIAVVRGRVANPRVRAWTFTLDGHDFYVLRLGDAETLIYDVLTKQWTEWDSFHNGAWRPNIGTTWVGAQKLGFKYGSNIVAGDDTFGLLWFLNPDQGYDDAPDPTYPQQQIPFTRVVTGQALTTGRTIIPCYALFLDGDNYGSTATDFAAAVQLDYSDDQGRTFVSAGAIAAFDTTGVANPYQWLSLGQISSPGRLFRITDNGVFQRLDSMGMNDDAG